jgi:PTH1 family peptidyl-tRNA hydrolase
MKLIVGLGNPGEKYKNTYHNIGFLVLDKIIKGFVFDKKFNTEIKKEKDIIYLKPHTFMNLSGQTVSRVASYYKIKPEDIWVISDDIYLPLGKLRIRKEGSAGGHNGIESIINELNAFNFIRFRIGIGRPEKIPYEKYVLQNLKKDESEIINKSIEQTSEAINFALETSVKETMDKFN